VRIRKLALIPEIRLLSWSERTERERAGGGEAKRRAAARIDVEEKRIGPTVQLGIYLCAGEHIKRVKI